VTQEFHLSITPNGNNEYTVRTESVADDARLGEEVVVWPVEEWLAEAATLMDDPLTGLLRGGLFDPTLGDAAGLRSASSLPGQGSGQLSTRLVQFGQRLYNELFQGTIRDSWLFSQGIAANRRQLLRFRLGLKTTLLHQLPWEVLYADDRPLSTGTDIVFSRYHSSYAVRASRLRPPKFIPDATQPLRILMVLAAPSDQEVLDLQQEARILKQELQTQYLIGQLPDIELTILEQPGREQLTQALEHNHYQVLHYAGHSNLGTAGGSLYLVSRTTGLTEILSGDDLAGLLVNNGIRMAVFNSCRSVYGATEPFANDPSNGNLAEALVRRGIPAVLAMAERIPNNVALNLSLLFYRSLKQGFPVDLSLSRARAGLITSYGSDQLYWALPILYLHPEFDGYLMASPTEPTDDFAYHSSVPLVGSAARANALAYAQQDPPPPADLGVLLMDDDLPEDLDEFGEFEDPDQLPTEEEKVARFVYELSQSPTLLEETDEVPFYSPEREQLLPTATPPRPIDYLQVPRNPQDEIEPPDALFSDPVDLSPEEDAGLSPALESVMADMGKLTDDIVTRNRAVRSNPTSAIAYSDLGWALYQEGYLKEAIAAYNQAIRLDASCALAFNRLGLAYYQQGRSQDAMRAYSRAVELDPTLTEASTNLKAILEREPAMAVESNLAPATRGGGESALSRPTNQSGAALSAKPLPQPTEDSAAITHRAKQPLVANANLPAPSQKRRIWFWSGLAAIATTATLASWAFSRHSLLLKPNPSLSPAPSVSPTNENARLGTEALLARATQQLKQSDWPAFQQTVGDVLNQPNLPQQQVEALLNSVPEKQANRPEVNFLKGKLAWVQGETLAGAEQSSVATIRQRWEAALEAQPSPMYANALGFAYYAEGNLEKADQVWQRSLQLITAKRANDKAVPPSAEELNAKAGLALAWFKLADRRPPDQQAPLRRQALQLRNQVKTDDPANFQPAALNLNWMWSNKTIKDWTQFLAAE
jgi:tetratricopeptide (TPR) repeat protein